MVAGAVASALIGLGEFAFGMPFAESLTLFKPKPTLAGSHLRLSGSFEYANIAAMFYELTVFLALAALLGALSSPRPRWRELAGFYLAVLVLLEAILLTYSRGALLGLLSGLAAFGWSARRNRRFRTLTLGRTSPRPACDRAGPRADRGNRRRRAPLHAPLERSERPGLVPRHLCLAAATNPARLPAAANPFERQPTAVR